MPARRLPSANRGLARPRSIPRSEHILTASSAPPGANIFARPSQTIPEHRLHGVTFDLNGDGKPDPSAHSFDDKAADKAAGGGPQASAFSAMASLAAASAASLATTASAPSSTSPGLQTGRRGSTVRVVGDVVHAGNAGSAVVVTDRAAKMVGRGRGWWGLRGVGGWGGGGGGGHPSSPRPTAAAPAPCCYCSSSPVAMRSTALHPPVRGLRAAPHG